jgi:hypothetical protein
MIDQDKTMKATIAIVFPNAMPPMLQMARVQVLNKAIKRPISSRKILILN